MSRAFDERELLERVDHDWEFLAETVEMLATDGRSLMAEVRRATAAGDAPALARAGHAIKGMISSFCAPSAHGGALAVEQIGQGGDLSPAPAAVRTLGGRLEALIADLSDFVATRT